MRAVVLHEGGLRVEEVPDLVPGPGQVLLDVDRAGICGSDLHARLDTADASAEVAAEVGYDHFLRRRDHVVLGHEFVGRVVAYGPDCRRRWPLGTRLVALPLVRAQGEVHMTGLSPKAPGAYAEQVLVLEDTAMTVPDTVPTTVAALVEPLAVAHHAVGRAGLRRGDTAVVVGCGPIGLAVVLMLRAAGVKRIIASDYSPARRELARRCGATVVDPAVRSPWDLVAPGHVTTATDLYGQGIDVLHRLRAVERVPWATVLKAARRAGAGPRGPVVFECVGVPGVIEQIVTGAPFLSRVVVVGVCMRPDSFRPTMASNKEIDLRFSFCYDPAEFHDTVRLLAAGRVDASPLVTGVVGLEGVAAAFDLLATAGEHAKIVVDPQQQGADVLPVGSACTGPQG